MNAQVRSALRWTCRIVAPVLLLSGATVAVLWGAGKVYEYRVERLYRRTLRLRVGASGFSDVQQLAKDYKRQVEWQSETCSPAECKFIIRIRHTTLPTLYLNLHSTITIGSSTLQGGSRLGTRPAVAAATVRVTDGKISYVSFGIAGVSPSGFFIEASFHAAEELTMFDRCRDSSLGRNSTYTVRAVPHRGFIQTAFGTAATEAVRTRATVLRIDCFITAMRGCNDVRELMPRAYEGYSGELDCDASFAKECQKFVDELESHAPPWKVESAFDAAPVTVNTWILTRCDGPSGQ